MTSDYQRKSTDKKFIAGAFGIALLLCGLLGIAQHGWALAIFIFLVASFVIVLGGINLVSRSPRLVKGPRYEALYPADQDIVARMAFVDSLVFYLGYMLGYFEAIEHRHISDIQAFVSRIHPDSAFVLPTHLLIIAFFYYIAPFSLLWLALQCVYWILGRKDSLRALAEFRRPGAKRRRFGCIAAVLVVAVALNRPCSYARFTEKGVFVRELVSLHEEFHPWIGVSHSKVAEASDAKDSSYDNWRISFSDGRAFEIPYEPWPGEADAFDYAHAHLLKARLDRAISSHIL